MFSIVQSLFSGLPESTPSLSPKVSSTSEKRFEFLPVYITVIWQLTLFSCISSLKPMLVITVFLFLAKKSVSAFSRAPGVSKKATFVFARIISFLAR